MLAWCVELRISTLSLWVLLTENLRRSPRELSGIFAAIEAKLGRLARDRRIRRHSVRVRAVGKLELLPDATLAAIRAAEAATADRQGMTLLIAVAYGGREEIADVPDPDLIIRTTGEIRLSGFMLWQSASSEFYFCDAPWPALRRVDFLRAVRVYQQRQRRFGR